MAKRKGLLGQLQNLRDSLAKQVEKAQDAITGLFGRSTKSGQKKRERPTEQPPRKRDRRSVVDQARDDSAPRMPESTTREPEQIRPEPVDDDDDDFDDDEYEFINQRFADTEKSIRRHEHGTYESALNYARDVPLPASSITIARDPSTGRFFVIVDHVS